jgi:hypothetical protein
MYTATLSLRAFAKPFEGKFCDNNQYLFSFAVQLFGGPVGSAHGCLTPSSTN